MADGAGAYRIPLVVAGDEGSPFAQDLAQTWETRAGWRGWLATVDHKEIGKRYLVTAFAFLILGGIEALLLRLQLAHANAGVLTPQQYNQVFTMHGVTMIFLYALPILSGFSNYLWPLMLGSRDMAFPRLNALSYWIFLFAGIFMYASFPLGLAPDAGWFNYVPYTSREFNPGPNIDIYALGMVLLGISTTVGSINFIVTLFRTRAPGMSINRVPIIVWGTLTASVGNVLAVPAVSLAFFMLWMDRQFGTHFFDITGGGHPLLWQHLFWMFGHPWVYALVLPAMGIVSDALPTFCRRPLVGYTPVALATVATMMIGFGVWTHHMFATGLPPLALSFFGAASFAIAVPSAVSVFAWIATIWTGRPVFRTPFLFFAGFIVLFVIGGVSGFMTAAVPLDWQLTDTYFIVAHLHYVLLGINVFPVIGGIYYWYPKMTGRMLDERLGKWVFWLMFVGFNVAFLPMHLTGLLGMPRRIYTYPAEMGWDGLNMVTTAGSFILAAGFLLFVFDVARSMRTARTAGSNPWDAPTLEWSMPSPPPAYNFAVIPTIASRHPLWEDRLREGTGHTRLHEGLLLNQGRETVGTTTLDAEPDVILKMPDDTYVPLLLAVALTALFVAMLVHEWAWTALAGVATAAAIVVWTWPRATLGQTRVADVPPAREGVEPDASRQFESALPIGSFGHHASGWYGAWALIITEAALFAYLLFSCFYLASRAPGAWPPEGLPALRLALPNTIILLASSAVLAWGEHGFRRHADRRRVLLGLGGAIVLGVIFVAVQWMEWGNKPFKLGDNAYASLYYTTTGFHIAHVLGGLIALVLLFVWTGRNYFGRHRHIAVTIGSIYWHFVDVVWLAVFFTYYVFPYLHQAA